ncbi:MAG: sugar MFS transporter [Bacteroides sp.]|nr:sugar MFS transporter [Bacteroides sp.]MCM1086282.1 sugar MFS transporter [Bacteroides sp.]
MFKKSPLAVIGILFFIFGFVTWLNSALVPFLKISCELNNFESYFVTFMFYIAYFIFAIPSARVIDGIGYKRSISVGLGVMAAGAALFIPAALTRHYLFFLAGLFLMGAGLALLQTAANPYAAVLGTPETAARRIGIMGVCNKFAGILAPLVLGSVTLKSADAVLHQLQDQALAVVQKEEILDKLALQCLVPYLCIVAVLALLALFIRRVSLPDIQKQEEMAAEAGGKDSVFRHGNLWGGVVALFFYVGAEVISVDSLINYAASLGISNYSAKMFPAMSMVAFLIGYLIGIAGIPRWFSQRTALILSAAGCLLVVTASLLVPGLVSVYLLVCLGLTNAMIWPAVWGLAIEGLGRHTSFGSSLLVMAIVGGALLPLLFGRLVDAYGHGTAYLLFYPCYFVILVYALWRKPKNCYL